ncbi:MAG: hypothetical protein V4479_11050 [Actinomycetota bacterium]
MTKKEGPAERIPTFLSPSFDDEPEIELLDPVDDDQLTDDNHPRDED